MTYKECTALPQAEKRRTRLGCKMIRTLVKGTAMISKAEYEQARSETLAYLNRAGIALTANEAERIEVADVGLGQLATIGLQLVVYINTERCCAKELVLFPRQT